HARAAGVVDEDVDAAELVDRALDEPDDCFLVFDVGRHGEAAVAALLGDSRGRGFELVDGAAADDDAGAQLCELERGGIADAGRPAGDDRDAAGEIELFGNHAKILPGTGRGTAEGGGGGPRLGAAHGGEPPPSALRAATSPFRGGFLVSSITT